MTRKIKTLPASFLVEPGIDSVSTMQQQKLVIGVGSPHGDDAVGWRVVEQLAARVPSTVQAIAVREPTQILPHLAQVPQ